MSSREDIRELADEYVLGLLDPDEQAAVELAIEADPALRAAVADSRDRFVEFDLAAGADEISDGLWARIEAATARTTQARTAEPSSRAGSPANDNRLVWWRRAAAAGLAASLVLATLLGWSLSQAPDPQVIAVLIDDAGEPVALVEDFGGESARLVILADIAVPGDRSIQVWTKPSEEVGPVSIGVIDAAMTTRLDGWRLPSPKEAQLYEITLEREGGSPTGLPTGPILGKGFAKAPR